VCPIKAYELRGVQLAQVFPDLIFFHNGASSLGQPFSLASETWDSQRAALLVKAEVKEAFSSSAFSSLGPSSHQALGFLQASPIPRQSPMHSNGSLI